MEGTVRGNCFGTYLHGLFDTGELTEKLASFLLARRGLDPASLSVEDGTPARRILEDRQVVRERQYDAIADTVRKSVDMGALYRIMGM